MAGGWDAVVKGLQQSPLISSGFIVGGFTSYDVSC